MLGTCAVPLSTYANARLSTWATHCRAPAQFIPKHLRGAPLSTDGDNVGMSDPIPEEPFSKEESQSMSHRQERIRVETLRHRIEGSLMLARDGYRSRVSDVLNASERDFLTLTEVTVRPLDGGSTEHHPFLTLARRHIVFATGAPESLDG
jgi:hypothetical protein